MSKTISNPFQPAAQQDRYIQSVQTKTKRHMTYTLILSQQLYNETISGKIKDQLKKIKSYYTSQHSSSVGEQVSVDYEFEVQAMFPSLSSIQAIGGSGIVKTTANTLTIKTHISFNFKKQKQVQSLSDFATVHDKLELFIQLVDHISEMSTNNPKLMQDFYSLINLHPDSIVRVRGSQIVLTDMIINCENQMSRDPELCLWYLQQMSPEQLQTGKCDSQSITWQLGCLLYCILTGLWPFLSTNVGAIRRNLVLQRYTRYTQDEEVQQAIFDRVFLPVDDGSNTRMSLKEMSDKVRMIVLPKFASAAPHQVILTSKQSFANQPQQDVSQERNQLDYQEVYGMANDGASELIEEDYYDEEQDNNNSGKKQRISALVDEDDQHSQSVPAFDQLPSVRSRMSNNSFMVNHVNNNNGGGGLTSHKLKMFENNNTPADFDNLPSMHSSEYTGGKQNSQVRGKERFEVVQKLKFDQNESERSMSQMESYRVKLSARVGQKKIIDMQPNRLIVFTENNDQQQIVASFLHSERQSEQSMNHDFDASSIHQQQQDTDMNAGDDQIGFLILPQCASSVEMVLGVTVEAGQFICFKTNPKGQWTNQVIPVQGGENLLVGGYRQVISVDSRKQGETLIIGSTNENTVNVFTFDSKTLHVALLKEMKQNVDCITPSFQEPQFFMAKQNKLQKVLIDPNPGPKCLVSKVKHRFYQSDQVKATALAYTVLKGSGEDDPENFMFIGTSDFSVVIMRISENGTQDEVLQLIDQAHQNDITSVLALTDNLNQLSFVSLGLDSLMKIYSFDGSVEYEAACDGQILTATVLPQKKDYFLVSTFNEESNMNQITVYKKQKMLFRVGGNFEECVLDMKIKGDVLYVPKGMSLTSVDRIEIKGL